MVFTLLYYLSNGTKVQNYTYGYLLVTSFQKVTNSVCKLSVFYFCVVIQKKQKMETAILFDSYKGLKNRIVMAPMTRSRAIGNIPNQLMATYYGQRASAGLIITEGVSPSPDGLGYARIPGIFSIEQVEGWKAVTKAVHENGGRIFAQLMHAGRIGHSANIPEGGALVGPSAISANTNMWTDTQGMQITETPREMDAQDIRQAIDDFARAAKMAVEAGFDGVELHAANGYLLEQFLNPHANNRTDQYGGSVANRARFVIEVAQAVVNAIGAEKAGIRLSPYGTFNTMPLYDEVRETYAYLSRELDKLNLFYLHTIDYAARASEEGKLLLQDIRRNFKNTLILNGGYTRERALNAIANGEADLISFGAPFIANPNLPAKLKNNETLVAADQATFYTADEKGYTDYN